MKLGAFPVSLNVKDIHKSKAFYEKLGFHDFGGDVTQNWVIMKHESCVIEDPDCNPIFIDQHR